MTPDVSGKDVELQIVEERNERKVERLVKDWNYPEPLLHIGALALRVETLISLIVGRDLDFELTFEKNLEMWLGEILDGYEEKERNDQ